MTRKELDWILSKVSDYMMLAKVDGKHKIYDVAAFSSAENYKVPIRIIFENNKTEYLILDYNSEIERTECDGVKENQSTLTLNCDAASGNKNAIEYSVDDELTSKLHKHLGSYLE